jgi:hypothetical protein
MPGPRKGGLAILEMPVVAAGEAIPMHAISNNIMHIPLPIAAGMALWFVAQVALPVKNVNSPR